MYLENISALKLPMLTHHIVLPIHYITTQPLDGF